MRRTDGIGFTVDGETVDEVDVQALLDRARGTNLAEYERELRRIVVTRRGLT